MSQVVVAGLDVFDRRWVGVVLVDGAVEDGFLVDEFGEALECIEASAKAIGVDIPIGLPERDERPADLAARARLRGAQASSVFMTPPSEVLRAADWDTALRLHKELRDKGMSLQTWFMREKILEVQRELERLVSARPIFEVHPEVSFWAMNHERPLESSKHTWAGHNLRRQLLESQGILVPADLAGLKRAGMVDVLDAAAAAWSAQRIASGTNGTLPSGAHGPGAIHY